MNNFLEQLVANWYQYQGYFVRTNIKFGKRPGGGYVGEIDVAAFNPKNKILIHLEVSGDADSWAGRQKTFQKKFKASSNHYESIFDFQIEQIRKIAVVGFSKPKKPIQFGNDIELIVIPGLVTQITEAMEKLDPAKAVISEAYPLLRAIQFAVWSGKSKFKEKISKSSEEERSLSRSPYHAR